MQKKSFRERNLIAYAYEENIFPLPKEKPYQHEEWTDKKKKNIFLHKKDHNLLLKMKSV